MQSNASSTNLYSLVGPGDVGLVVCRIATKPGGREVSWTDTLLAHETGAGSRLTIASPFGAPRTISQRQGQSDLLPPQQPSDITLVLPGIWDAISRQCFVRVAKNTSAVIFITD